MKPMPQKSPKAQAFDVLWKEIFSSSMHLDSALSKAPRKLKMTLAQAIPPILLRPTTLAEAAGVGVAPGEPWNLEREQLTEWAPAQGIAERIFDGSLDPRRYGRSVSADFPDLFLKDWERDWGPSIAQELAQTLGAEPPVGLRAKRAVGAGALARALAPQLPVRTTVSDLSPVGVRLAGYAPVMSSESFERGDFEIQDEGSQVIALFSLWPELYAPLLQEAPGMARSGQKPAEIPASVPAWTVVDACAGAGGKTLALADLLGGKGRVYSYDTAARKLQALRRRAKRAGITNFQVVALTEGGEQETVARFRRRAQAVLVDAPCSGWGVLRRSPDIKWRQDPDALERMPRIQQRLLGLYSDLVAPGGQLTYGVCTFRKSETREVVEAFLREHKDFEAGPGGYLGPGPCDGFFMQSFIRKKG